MDLSIRNTSSIEIRIPYADTDQMGVVYYANYFVYFERGRTEWLRGKGITYKELEKQGLYLPVFESSCKYYAPVHYDDMITVCTKLSEIGLASLKFECEVYVNNRLAAKGMTLHPIVDSDFKPLRMPQDLKRKLVRND